MHFVLRGTTIHKKMSMPFEALLLSHQHAISAMVGKLELLVSVIGFLLLRIQTAPLNTHERSNLCLCCRGYDEIRDDFQLEKNDFAFMKQLATGVSDPEWVS